MFKSNPDKYNIENIENLNITEKVVYVKLLEICSENIEIHPIVKDCPFNKSRRHEVDFLIKSKSKEELYIEVKGQMTYSEVNKLKYLIKNTDKSFYILQLTESDWIEGKNGKDTFEIQFAELSSFYNDKYSPKKMQQISWRRLSNFVKNKKQEYKKWCNTSAQNVNN